LPHKGQHLPVGDSHLQKPGPAKQRVSERRMTGEKGEGELNRGGGRSVGANGMHVYQWRGMSNERERAYVVLHPSYLRPPLRDIDQRKEGQVGVPLKR